ncbi:hypothetical protein F4803DRAFT_514418 [Xylaria telfairii]|nr:hypothetical protein F4803DRAFT_514418 [Xylaria telfairii]
MHALKHMAGSLFTSRRPSLATATVFLFCVVVVGAVTAESWRPWTRSGETSMYGPGVLPVRNLIACNGGSTLTSPGLAHVRKSTRPDDDDEKKRPEFDSGIRTSWWL